MRSRALLLLLTFTMIYSLAIIGTVKPAQAQGVKTLKYSDTSAGEITNDAYEVQFKFTGKKGDLVAVQMRPIEDKDYKSVSAVVVITDAKNKALVDTSNIVGAYGISALAITPLGADGDYTIIATRTGGRAGETIGAFTLDLWKVDALVIGKEVSGTATSGGASHASVLYSLNSKASFGVTLSKTGGDFNPELSIYDLGENGDLSRVAVANGSKTLVLNLVIEGGEDTFIVSVDDTNGYFFQDEKKSANFKLVASLYPASK